MGAVSALPRGRALTRQDLDEPSITVWQLRGGRYVESAHVAGAGQVDLDNPYPVTVDLDALIYSLS